MPGTHYCVTPLDTLGHKIFTVSRMIEKMSRKLCNVVRMLSRRVSPVSNSSYGVMLCEDNGSDDSEEFFSCAVGSILV